MSDAKATRKPLPHSAHRLPINVDLVAIGIGLALAVLIRFNVIHQIGF
jgi:hypothetical protein